MTSFEVASMHTKVTADIKNFTSGMKDVQKTHSATTKAIVKNTGDMESGVDGVSSSMKNLEAQTVQTAGGFIRNTGIIESSWTDFKKLFGASIEEFKDDAATWGEDLKNIGKIFSEGLPESLKVFYDQLKSGEAWADMKNSASDAVDAVKGGFDNLNILLEPAWADFKSDATDAFNSIKKAGSTTWSRIKMGLSSLSTKLSTSFISIKNKFSNAWGDMKKKGTELRSSISSGWDGLKTSLSTAWNSLSTKAADIAGSIRDSFVSAWNSIKTTGNTVWTGLTGAWESLKSLAGDFYDWLSGQSGEGSTKKATKTLPKRTKQWGGDITKTGYYYLHSGETVVPTKDSQLVKQGNNYKTSHFNNMNMSISMIVNTPIDLYDVQRRIKDIQLEAYRERAGKA
jgi:hypothetical protein